MHYCKSLVVMGGILTLVLATMQVKASSSEPVQRATPAEARAIAEEAYIYAFPMMQNYKTMYYRSVVGEGKPFNQWSHRHALLDPAFTAIVGPNNDTLYSSVWLDLREEPMVISVPAIPVQRYYSIQLIDMFVHNFAYIGQRSTGSEAGSYVIVGPGQNVGEVPGAAGIYHAESDFVFAIGRMLAKDTQDQKVAAALQKNISVQPLSQFLGQEKPVTLEPVKFPVYSPQGIQTPAFIELFNFLLQYVEIHPDEQEMFERFKLIGIGPDNGSYPANRNDDIEEAIAAGVNAGHLEIENEAEVIGSQVNGWNTTFSGFGSREVMQGQFLLRAAAAKMALYGNDREENSSFTRQVDRDRHTLDGSKASYALRFEKGEMPPVEGFWSLTMYRLPEILLYENDIHRYSIGDRTQDLYFAADGSLTLYLQHERPAGAKAANWLPAPAGPFAIALRGYLPKASLLTGRWLPPELIRTE